jgi:hypothetical protein
MAIPAFIAKLGEAMAKLSDRVLEFVSPEKSVEAINRQIDPQMEVYRQMMTEISEAEDISTEKKVELLNEIANNIDLQQYHANEKLEKRQKDASDVAIKVIGAIFTAGISLTPELIRRFKAANPQIEEAKIDELIEESAPEEILEDDVIDADFIDCETDWTNQKEN